ncbi:hypothetical protein B0H63DRAFT_481189 [Podospora didyma]|uniref:Uncharacterized protein n=1 Tax=Podospora didyma TaxID=330526 RepID=A0AAE0KFD1_9PEZI|nr:hypothetical protein B0H63DRAFT_481189 [Podospora didyma]
MSQSNGMQLSPTPLRNVVNGLNQGTFMSNAQQMMASYNAANNGPGMATSPGAGLSMPAMPAGSPRSVINPQNMPAVTARLREFENHYRLKHPTFTQEHITRLATEHLSRLIVQSQQAMNAAAGGAGVAQQQQQQQQQQQPMNGMTTTTSPHQYAQLLRAQQQAQQQQAASQQQAMQHQRQPSGSATPAPTGK